MSNYHPQDSHFQSRLEAIEGDRGFDKTKPQRKSLRLKVLVFEIGDEAQIREHDVDFSKGKNRLWFCNLIVWACCNQKLVKIFKYE